MDEAEATKVVGLVPEVYYDLIARLPAGGLVVLAVVAIHYPTIWGHLSELHAGSALIWGAVFVGSAYIAGLLLSSIGEFVIRLVGWDYWWLTVADQYPDQIKYARREFYSDYAPKRTRPGQIINIGIAEWRKARRSSAGQCRKMYRHIHEFLKDNHLQARVVLPKMQAEAALCANTAAGLLFIIASLVLSSPRRYWELAWSVIAFFVALYATRSRTKRLMERHFSYLERVRHADSSTIQPDHKLHSRNAVGA